MEVEEGRGAIPINLETPASLRKRYKADHQGAYVHQAGGGSTHSDVEVSIISDWVSSVPYVCLPTLINSTV